MAPDLNLSAAQNLEGVLLSGGWKVIEKVKRQPGSTGGHFSIGYIVENDGQTAFLKALNVVALMQSGQSLIDLLADVASAHRYERDLFLLCKDSKLTKVNLLIDHGQISVPGYIFKDVPYLIFERADGDVRSLINFSDNIDTAWKFKSLHNVAIGLSQLHKIEVAHQDLKPSNVFVFNHIVSKIGDLGRSLSKTLDAPHKDLDFAGDLDYSPPEVWYGYVIPEWNKRVFSIDLYLFGSLITFYFSGLNMSTLISKYLDDTFHFSKWPHTFQEVSPYLIEAFNKALNELCSNVSNPTVSREVRQLVEKLCFPIPEKRGDPKSLSSNYTPYELSRFASKLDLLYRRAEAGLLK